MEGQEKYSLPGAGTVLIYGILSIFLSIPLVFCCPLGLIFAIMGIRKGKRVKSIYLKHPENYVDYGQLNLGLILSHIGLVVSIIVLLLFLLFFSPMIAWFLAFLGGNY